MDLAYKTAVVLKATAAQGLRQELIVECDGEEAQAVNFLELTGPCRVGDQVVINTTAVDLKLGTGGWHFVMAIWGRSASLHGVGHIMKLRYTPMQGRVLSVEEEASEYHHLFQGDWSLEGAPVMVGSLHSMLAPCAFAFKARHPGKRLAYLMSDGAGLPLALSRTVPDLKARGLVDAVITFGHAFGGDYEAVNIYSALVAARHPCGADAVVVLMGPGVVGTGTKWGTTALEQGVFLNAVHHLQGTPIALVRMSEADPRPRHRGVSHHTLTVLGQIALPGCVVPLPACCRGHKDVVSTLQDLNHTLTWHDTEALFREMLEAGLKVTTMGRGPQTDPLFFHAALAGGLEGAQHITAT
jgi:hypothetical protein